MFSSLMLAIVLLFLIGYLLLTIDSVQLSTVTQCLYESYNLLYLRS